MGLLLHRWMGVGGKEGFSVSLVCERAMMEFGYRWNMVLNDRSHRPGGGPLYVEGWAAVNGLRLPRSKGDQEKKTDMPHSSPDLAICI